VIYHLTQWLDPNAESLLRLGYRYVSFRGGVAFLMSMFIVLWLLPKSFDAFTKLGWVNRQRSYMIDSSSKEGVPVMGGIHIFIASFICMLLWCDLTDLYALASIVSAVAFFALGLGDDILKIKAGHHDDGVSRAIKYAVQISVGAALGWMLMSSWGPHEGLLQGTFSFPFVKEPIQVGWLQIPICIFVVVFISNAVNFADGMDGLATGPSLLTFLGLAIFSYILGNAIWSKHFLFFFFEDHGIASIECSELVVVCCAMMGALMGFLWYNAYPATIFMGDCGSMYLGGVMATIFILLKQEMLFPILGCFFVIELLSVLIQDWVGIGFLGKRIFYRAPFHEYLKYLGYSEPKIVVRMWILSAGMMVISLLSIKMR
jgi:phospho-N-acetylmuramoyl-pentapeptide-transferase